MGHFSYSSFNHQSNPVAENSYHNEVQDLKNSLFARDEIIASLMQKVEALEIKSAPHNHPTTQKKKAQDFVKTPATSTSKQPSNSKSSKNSNLTPAQNHTNKKKTN
ncbi:hypothetical protein O181_040310 [Austropuccinia psidii MF-1]|uniref:Uncharacterized protein n=1 Tax=Austropuccinia psidii MF-1 TaxID=1389203 RepID=A0A9Q3DCZ1_9BASI|nr:hypothetical protein [Austropuccinia psidii MF-1]